MSFITRFAPSPTGDLHIGSVRTALYCWLFAKKHRGTFILRIEDTDLERSTESSVKVILDGLKWLNLTWDVGPIFQSERFPRYTEVAKKLLSQGLAYRCDCTKERLENLRNLQMQNKQKPKYDGHCRDKQLTITHNKPYVIRFKNPLDGYVEFDDLIRGKIKTANQELDDLVLLRSDLTPTYNFTVVVDDLDLQITDVIRGEDHISNTPKQINLFKALNAKFPQYAHISMILDKNGTKLSKRQGSASVLTYQKLGILPEALLNCLVRLGWSYKDQEIFSLQEMIDLFDIKNLHKSAAIFNIDKLLSLNQHYIMHSDSKRLIEPLKEQLINLGIEINNINANNDIGAKIISNELIKIIDLYKNRVKTIKEMAEEITYIFSDNYMKNLLCNTDGNYYICNEILNTLHNNHSVLNAMQNLYVQLHNLTFWNSEQINNLLKTIIANFNLKFSELAIPLRIIVTGKEHTPSIDKVLELIGQDAVLIRLNKILKIYENV